MELLKLAELMDDLGSFIDEDHRRWTQGAFAKDYFGIVALVKSREAVRFCPIGLVESRVNDRPLREQIFRYLYRAISHRYWLSISRWNDKPERTAGEATDAFHRAASLCRQQAINQMKGVFDEHAGTIWA